MAARAGGMAALGNLAAENPAAKSLPVKCLPVKTGGLNASSTGNDERDHHTKLTKH
jgi:hypothetical protein